MSDYMLTYTGRRINIETFSEKDICLEDIAHHLASYRNSRFGGALSYPLHYSVADHCMAVAEYVLDETESISAGKLALMHDAAEAYLGDMPTHLKKHLPDYVKLEARFEKIIFNKYGISLKYKAIVKEVDKRILLDEVLSLRPTHYSSFIEQTPGISPLGIRVRGISTPTKSKRKFLEWCEYLDIEDS